MYWDKTQAVVSDPDDVSALEQDDAIYVAELVTDPVVLVWSPRWKDHLAATPENL